MTREEAITWCDRFNDAWANADPEDDFPDLKYSDTLDTLFYLAGQALRQQECVGEANKALTLDELRKMDGEPVWVEHYHGGEWIVVHWNIYGRITTAYNAELRYDEYGERWTAYRHKPEEDKHETD